MITSVLPHFWQLKHPTEVKNHFVLQTSHFSFRQFKKKRLISSDASFGSNLLAWRLREPLAITAHSPTIGAVGTVEYRLFAWVFCSVGRFLSVFMTNLQNLSPGNE